MSTTIIMEPDVQQKLAILGSEASRASGLDWRGTMPKADTGNRSSYLYLVPVIIP